MLTYLAATWLGLNAGIATALAAAYRRHNRHLTDRAHDFDRHADEALAVAAWDYFGYHDAADTPEYAALVATFARIDAAVECWAAEIAACADTELQELIAEEGER